MRFHILSNNTSADSNRDLEDSIHLWELISEILWIIMPLNEITTEERKKIGNNNEGSIFEILKKLQTIEDKIIYVNDN